MIEPLPEFIGPMELKEVLVLLVAKIDEIIAYINKRDESRF